MAAVYRKQNGVEALGALVSIVTVPGPPLTSARYVSALDPDPSWTSGIAWFGCPSKVRLTAPQETLTDAPVPGGRCRFTVSAPPLIVMGTTPDGLPRVMSSRLAPVLMSMDLRGREASLNVSVDAPPLEVTVHGMVELIWRSSVNRRVWKTPNPLFPCEIVRVPSERSRLTCGLGPEYVMGAWYRSPSSELVPATVMFAAPASISSAAWVRVPRVACESSLPEGVGLGARATYAMAPPAASSTMSTPATSPFWPGIGRRARSSSPSTMRITAQKSNSSFK